MRTVFENDTVTATPELSADQVDEWDSLSHIALMFAVEREFGVTLSVGDITNMQNVGEFVELLQSKLETK